MIFHGFCEPMACYMKNTKSKNLGLRMDCKLIDEDNGQSTSLLDMDSFTPDISFQPVLSTHLGGCYFQWSQQIYRPLEGN
jgi:hypothetical protein